MRPVDHALQGRLALNQADRPLPLRGVVRVPAHCVWELTTLCNLDCVHCESACGEARDRELSTAEALALCDELAAIGCHTVNLSGGEPFLRSDWEEICRRLVELEMEPVLVSNLTFLKPAHVQAMEAAGVRSVATSIDGTREVHDRIRRTRGPGPSPFLRTMDAIAELEARGFFVSVITHVSRWNLGTLDEVALLLDEAAVDLWQIQVGFPEGRLREIADEYLVRPGELEDLYAFVLRTRARSSIRIDVADNIGYYGPRETEVRRFRGRCGGFWAGCLAGYRVLAIDSRGGVRGCPSLAIEVGDVRERPLREIWADERLFWFNACWDETRLEGRCRGCSYRRICRGGCKSLALSTTGTIYRNIYCLHQVADLGGDPDRREDHGVLLP